MRVRAASADFGYERGAATFSAPSAILRKWQNPQVFAYFGPPRASCGPLSARKWASRPRRMRFWAAARWPRFYAYDRRMRVGARGMRDGRGFVAIYGTSGPHPPKQAKLRLFLGGCVLTPSERSYPRDWSAGRAPLLEAPRVVPGPAPNHEGMTRFPAPKTAKKAEIAEASRTLRMTSRARNHDPRAPSVTRVRCPPIPPFAYVLLLATLAGKS